MANFNGTNGADVITVSNNAVSGYDVTGSLNDGAGLTDSVIVVNGLNGADTIDLTGLTAAAFIGVPTITVNGGGHDDILLGGILDETFIGGDGTNTEICPNFGDV